MDLQGTFEINQIPVRLTNKWGENRQSLRCDGA